MSAVVKYKESDFKFEMTPQKLRKEVLADYEERLAKKNKDEFDKMYISVVKEKMKQVRMKLVCTHTKTGVKKSFGHNGELTDENKKQFVNQVIELIRVERGSKKQSLKYDHKKFDGAAYRLIGGVFDKPGQINIIAKNITSNDPYSTKVPRKPKAHYVGVELEINAHPTHDIESIAKALQDAKLSRYVQVGEDGSCGGGAPGVRGYEVRCLFEEGQVEEKLTAICKVIRDLGLKTDEFCGTHVHLDMRNRDIKKCYANMFKAQALLRKFLLKHRKKNVYCKKNDQPTYETHMASTISVNHGRRYAINTHAYEKYKTLEVRMHQGVLDETKLIPWINLLVKIVNYEGVLEKAVPTLKQARTSLKLDDKLFKDLSARLMNRGA